MLERCGFLLAMTENWRMICGITTQWQWMDGLMFQSQACGQVLVLAIWQQCKGGICGFLEVLCKAVWAKNCGTITWTMEIGAFGPCQVPLLEKVWHWWTWRIGFGCLVVMMAASEMIFGTWPQEATHFGLWSQAQVLQVATVMMLFNLLANCGFLVV